MKNLKISFVTLLVLTLFLRCSDDDPVIEYVEVEVPGETVTVVQTETVTVVETPILILLDQMEE